MEVKPGYKRTDVGVFPNEWEVTKLGDLATLKTGPFGSLLHKSDYTLDGIPVVNPIHIVGGQIVPDRRVSVTPAAVRAMSDFCLREGDVVLARRGDMGRCAVVGRSEDGWLCGTGSLIVRSGSRIVPAFLQRVLSSPQVIQRIEDASVGSTMVNLNHSTLHNLLIQKPPLPEQQTIAAALGDVDALLASLERLITKKRDLKQAAMQQLLTGQTRLPGFSVPSRPEDKPARDGIPQGWTKERIGKLGNWFSGGTPSMGDERLWNGEIPWISAKDMKVSKLDDSILHVTPLAVGNGTRLLPRGALLMVVRGMILAHTFPVAITMRPMAFNQDLKALVVRDGVSSLFVLLSLQLSEPKILSLASESTHGTKRLASADFFAFEILLPSLEEQIAIAAVLSDMDAEIATLEERRDKTKLLKEGMMQELMTGRTRLR